jgi:hypothetical protein
MVGRMRPSDSLRRDLHITDPENIKRAVSGGVRDAGWAGLSW